MIEIKKHTENKVSILFNNGIREFFYNLLNFDKSGLHTYLILSRPNFKVEINYSDNNLVKVYSDKTLFEQIIYVKGNLIDMVNSIEWGWKTYEHFQIILTKKELIKNDNSCLKKTAESNALILRGLAIQKGIEENVVWIEKSNFLEFPDTVMR